MERIMTRKILYQDWLYNRRTFAVLLILMPVYFIYTSWSITGPRAQAFITGLLTAFISFTLFLREDKFKAQPLICSLPVTRRQIVQARFTLMWMVVIALYLSFLLVTLLSPLARLDLLALLRPGLVFLFLATATVIVAIMFPFSVYFGAMGFIIVLVALQFAGIALQALIVAFGMGRSIGVIPEAISAGLADFRSLAGGPLYFLTVGLAILALNLAAREISVRLFIMKQL
jgi:hypothetical protein